MVQVQIKVIANAKKDEIVSWQEDLFRIRIHAPPEKGKANERLISFLAQKLDIPQASIQIISGLRSSIKRLQIDGLSLFEIQKKLGKL